ncbi:MAG TPA: HD domain-containing protein [Limnochordia bacterium]|nr:HD domain-containing protein [Limnochordia bacterium]
MIVRDAVHGDIELTAEETRLLDAPEMQRLRRIKQLGLASLVYPGATHTRFEHSLGTLFTARRVIQSLRHNGHPVEAEAERRICAAALLHDVTHIPFGHTFEDERAVFARHDTPARIRAFLRSGALGERLAALGLREAVSALLLGELPAARLWEREIVSSALDADLMDYLRRDAYYTGIRQDFDDRIFRTFVRSGGRLAVAMHQNGVDRADVRSEVVHLLRMRYFLTERVYYHHTKIVAGAMLSKALERSVAAGVTERELYPLGDETLFAFIHARGDAGARALIERILERRLLKRTLTLAGEAIPPDIQSGLIHRFHDDCAARADFERALAAAAGLPEHEVILSVPAATQMKEAAVTVLTARGLTRLNALTAGGAWDIRDLEARYAALWRLQVFAPEEARDKVERAARRLLAGALGREPSDW